MRKGTTMRIHASTLWILLLSLALVAGCLGSIVTDDDDAADDDISDDDDDTGDDDDDDNDDDDNDDDDVDDDDDDDADDDTADDDTSDDDTSDDDDDAADDDTSAVFDCATIPTAPLSQTVLAGAKGYHGLAFDGQGNIIGSDNSALIKSDYQGSWALWVPGQGTLEQMASFPNGDIVVSSADSGALKRITPGGTVTTIAPGLSAYGVLLGPDDMIYAANWDRIYRVDPDTGQTDVWLELPTNDYPHSLNFNNDFTRMYIGTVANGGMGKVFYADLDANLDPIGDADVFATQVGQGWHDAVGVDCCGNLYVPDYWSSRLYRISPAGVPEVYYQWNGNQYGHGLIWGDGIGGWRTDALYLPMPYGGNEVQELVIGVPDREFVGTVLNAP